MHEVKAELLAPAGFRLVCLLSWQLDFDRLFFVSP
jgi:hypothetical protein